MHHKVQAAAMPSPAPVVFILLVASLAAFVLTGSRASAANLNWDANGTTSGQTDGTGAWLAGNQWWDGTTNVGWTSGDAASFGNGGTGNAVTLASPTVAASLTFNSFSGTYTLGTASQTITLNNGISKNSGSGAVSIISPIVLGGPQIWTHNASTALTASAALDNAGHLFTVDGTGPTSLTGVIGGSGGLTKNGPGRLIYHTANNNTYTGPTTINGGTLMIGSGATSLSPGNLILNGGILEFYWTTTFTRTLGTGNDQIQIVGGASGFSENGSTGGTVRLNNSASYEVLWGSAFFNPSTLVLQAATAQNSSSLTFDNKIDLNGSTRTIFTSPTTGSGAGSATLSQVIRNSQGTPAGLVKTGGGRLNLNAANTYNGGTTLQEGTLQLGNASSLGPSVATLTVNGGLLNLNNQTVGVGNLTGTGGTLANNGTSAITFTIGNGGGSDGNFQGVIANNTNAGAGSLALVKTGAATLILSGNNTFTGSTAINGGTLQIGAGGTTGSLATSAITNNFTLVYNRSNDFSVGYAISGFGDLIKQGAGKMTFTTPAAYGGDTTISAGTLKLNAPNTNNDASTISIAATGATLELNFSGTDTVQDFVIGGTPMALGVYKAVGNPVPGIEIPQITGNGTVTVVGDVYPPALVSFANNNTARFVAANTMLAYTVTFSEDMNAGSFSSSDFANAGTALISIGSIIETAPGVFTVQVTPASEGTVRLQIPAGATLTDVIGNPLGTTSAIMDVATILVYEPDPISPALRGLSLVANSSGAALAITMPAGVKPGDLLVANIAQFGSSSGNPTASGWTLGKGGKLGNNTSYYGAVLYKVAGVSETGPYSFTLSGGSPAAAGIIMAFSGVDTVGGPFDATPPSLYSATSATTAVGPATQVTTVSSNASLLMLGMAVGTNSVSWSGWSNTSPGALTELYDITGSGSGNNATSLGAAWAVKAAPGATGTGSATLSASTRNGSIQLALKPSYSNSLLSALAALKAHVTGATPLTDPQIAGHKATIVAQQSRFGSSATTIAAAFDLVRSYDDTLGALWVARTLPDRALVTDDLHYTIYTVMQAIVDRSYTSTNLANLPVLMNNFAFKSSANFPGPCAPPTDPNQVHTAVISGNYLNTWGRPTFHEDTSHPAPKPTGTYLAPGSIATVTVPASLVGRGYRIRVGAHSWDYTSKPFIKRLDRCSLVYNIISTDTQVANPLGGGIYIEVPQYVSNVGIVNVQIKNAVRSPYFSAKSFHQTTLSEWQNTERLRQAPWADFQSEKVMMQVPTSWIYALPDPVKLMADWDLSADICNDLMGFPRDRGRETIYNQVDVLIRSGAYAPGYPAVNNTYTPGANYNGYANSYLVRGPQFAPDFEFHESGHGYLFPKFPGEVESVVNLLHVPVWHVGFGYSLDEAFRKSRSGYTNYATLDTTAIAWMMCDNFLNGIAMEQVEKQYQLKGHAKFVEIARMFGWKKLNDHYKTFNTDYENNVSIPTDVDSMLLRLSRDTGLDMRPLFHFWGVPPINNTTLGNSITTANLPASRAIYDTLVRYKSLVPTNNTTFRTFANGWWGRQPLSTGYTEERNHATRWDSYNEASATATANRAQQIIDLYFPTGRPSDYGDWRSQWAASNLVNPQADLDGDGMSNDHERIWGMDPTVPMFKNPIQFNSGLQSGSFSYTRRNRALTGLNYTVWTSTNLNNWTEDTGAQQTPGTPDATGVQTVETVLSPGLLANPALFIRMRASE